MSAVCFKVCVLTLLDEEVGQRTHGGVTAVQEVTAHQLRAGQRQT